MTNASNDRAGQGTAALLGALSVASGAILLVAPRSLTELFKLPRTDTVGRTLGLRDVVAGTLLLTPSTRRAGLLLRGASDATDALLAASETLRGQRPLRSTAVTIVGGLALAVLSFGLARRRAR